MIDHDQLFKSLIKTFFADFVRLVEPRLSSKLRLETVQFLEQEHFSRPVRGSRVALDLVAEVKALRGPPWLVHIEIERVFRRTVPRRMSRYYMHLRLDHRRAVLPIVLYLRGGPAGVEWIRVEDVLGGYEINRFSYLGFGLSRCSAESYLQRPEPIAWALAALMRPETMSSAEHKLRCLRAVARATLTESQRFLLLEVVETYLVLEDDERTRYHEMLTQERNQEVEAMEMTWSQKIRAQGLEQGLTRGRTEGARRALTRILERRFGPLAEAFDERLEAITDLALLERLMDRALEIRSLHELDLDRTC